MSVACGAFGAHALKGRVAAGLLAPERLDVWHTAAQYQMWHALALFAVVIATRQGLLPPNRFIPYGLVTGTVLFSGSLYALVLTGMGALGAITPVGGVIWLASWLGLAVIAARQAPAAAPGK